MQNPIKILNSVDKIHNKDSTMQNKIQTGINTGKHNRTRNKIRLGINTGFALNRYPLPEQWGGVIGYELGLKYVQLTADLCNPSLGESIISDYVKRIKKIKSEYGFEIESIMTGAFTRVNHFSHPDEKVRRFWLDWFMKLVDIASQIGAKNVSSHLGILAYESVSDPSKYEIQFKETINNWKALAKYAKTRGIEYLAWEPMSIKREYGETIEQTRLIQNALEGSAIPVLLCLDVDHGDPTSKNPDDYDPYKWIELFGSSSPMIHIKQSLADKGGHYPFIKEYNEQGKITAERLIDCVSKNCRENTLLLLEMSFREREPTDSLVLQHLKESAEYWKRHLKY